MALGAGATAMASGYVSAGHYSPGHSYGYYAAGYHGGDYYNYGYGHGYGYGYGNGYGHGGGGAAAAVVLGAIGGAIILNEVSESRANRRAYDDRYYDRYDRYSSRARPLNTGYAGRERLPRESYGGAGEAGTLKDESLDASLDGGPAPIRISSGAAYATCVSQARAALADRNFTLAVPDRPDTADDIGGAWKMTANVTTQSPQGESWTRAMYCEADASRVYLLELL
jgi:hypothetical protein